MTHRILLVALSIGSFALLAHAQPGGGRGGEMLIRPGTMLPQVIAVDEQGEEFSTASLRGSYTVLVFGCLT